MIPQSWRPQSHVGRSWALLGSILGFRAYGLRLKVSWSSYMHLLSPGVSMHPLGFAYIVPLFGKGNATAQHVNPKHEALTLKPVFEYLLAALAYKA